MPFSSHLLEFSKFFLVGMIIGIIFDFFRAYRKEKNISNLVVTIQDIIFFIIIFVIMIFSILFILDTEIRFYIFGAIFIGICTYIKIFSKLVISVIFKILVITRKIASFVFLPLTINFEFISKIYKKIEKYAKKCCKKFSYMILSIHESFFVRLLKQKRFLNGKLKKDKKKRKKK